MTPDPTQAQSPFPDPLVAAYSMSSDESRYRTILGILYDGVRDGFTEVNVVLA